MALRSRAMERLNRMSSNRTNRMNSRGLRGGGRALLVLGAAGLMLGAHYSRPTRPCGPAGCAPTGAAAIHAGAASAATRDGWSRARNFRRLTLAEWGGAAALDSAQFLTVLKLNRVDEKFARRRVLLVPDSVAPELAYAPFPEAVFSLRASPKFVLVSRRVQAFAAYEYGALVRWGPISSGKTATPTDAGLFFTNWKSRTTISTDDPSWILDWYVNFIALKGVAFHQYELPGLPASHGCVRLLETDARWMYTWAEQWVPGRGSNVKRYGTPVLVFGDWEAGAPAPWLGVVNGDTRAAVSTWEVGAALAPHLELVQARQDSTTELAAR